MKVVTTDGKGAVTIHSVAMPSRDEYDCLVKMEACVLCNSTDRYIVEGAFSASMKYPVVLGHESVGIIQETGKRAVNFKPGDRVLRAGALYSGEQLDGFGNAWGGLAEFGKVRDGLALVRDGVVPEKAMPGRNQQVVPKDIDLDHSLLLIPFKEILSVVSSLRDVPGGRFLVAGAGITGCLFGRLLKLKGARQVTLCARRQAALEFALRQQAADRGVLLSELRELESDYDALVDASGSLDVCRALAEKVRPGKWIYSYAIYKEKNDSAFDFLRSGHSYTRVSPAEATAHEEACRLIREKAWDPLPFITHQFPLQEIVKAWATVINKTTLKTVVRFG